MHGNTAHTGYGVGVTELDEGSDSSLDEVVRVGRALGLSQHVLNTYRLEHGTHRTSGLHSGTGSGGLHEYPCSAELGLLLVRNGSLVQRHLDEILLGVLYTLGYSCGDFVGLSETITYDTLLIAYYYDCSAVLLPICP